MTTHHSPEGHHLMKRTLSILATAGLALGLAVTITPAASATDSTQVVAWYATGYVDGYGPGQSTPTNADHVTWPQSLYREQDCGGVAQVDTYKYGTPEEQAKVEALIAGGTLNKPGTTEPLDSSVYLSHTFKVLPECAPPTTEPTEPTTSEPTTSEPTTSEPTTSEPETSEPPTTVTETVPTETTVTVPTETTVTETVPTETTVIVPTTQTEVTGTTATETAPGTTATQTIPGTTATETAPGTETTVTQPGTTVTESVPVVTTGTVTAPATTATVTSTEPGTTTTEPAAVVTVAPPVVGTATSIPAPAPAPVVTTSSEVAAPPVTSESPQVRGIPVGGVATGGGSTSQPSVNTGAIIGWTGAALLLAAGVTFLIARRRQPGA